MPLQITTRVKSVSHLNREKTWIRCQLHTHIETLLPDTFAHKTMSWREITNYFKSTGKPLQRKKIKLMQYLFVASKLISPLSRNNKEVWLGLTRFPLQCPHCGHMKDKKAIINLSSWLHNLAMTDNQFDSSSWLLVIAFKLFSFNRQLILLVTKHCNDG